MNQNLILTKIKWMSTWRHFYKSYLYFLILLEINCLLVYTLNSKNEINNYFLHKFVWKLMISFEILSIEFLSL